jgi:hypothetical protein
MSRDAYNEFLELQNFLAALPPVDHDDNEGVLSGVSIVTHQANIFSINFEKCILSSLFFEFGTLNAFPKLKFSRGCF